MTGNVLPTLLPGFAGTILPGWLAARLRAGLGGVCLFAANLESLDQLRVLTDAIYAENPRALIAIDEEGGDVTRLFARRGIALAGQRSARFDSTTSTPPRTPRVEIGLPLRRTGLNLNFAPSVDINSNPDNPVIGVRSFGDTAEWRGPCTVPPGSADCSPPGVAANGQALSGARRHGAGLASGPAGDRPVAGRAPRERERSRSPRRSRPAYRW